MAVICGARMWDQTARLVRECGTLRTDRVGRPGLDGYADARRRILDVTLALLFTTPRHFDAASLYGACARDS